MADTAVSTVVAYNHPAVTTVVTTHCGEVYSSEKFEDFVINCTKCDQVFDLLNVNLYIEHVKRCLSAESGDLTIDIKPNINFTTENILPSSNSIIKFEEDECTNFDALSSMKQQTESFNEVPIDDLTLGEYKPEPMFIDPLVAEEIIDQDQQNNRRQKDPLPLIKEEEEEEEDEISKTITLGIIEEYKKHPCLWDIDFFRASSRPDRFRALQAITNAINVKYNTSFDEMAIKSKILLLRGNYRRVLRTKEDIKSEHPNQKSIFPIHLYYLDQISFIGTTFDDEKLFENNPSSPEQIKEVNDDDQLVLVDDSDGDYKSDKGEPKLFEGTLSRNRELATCFIEEYKKQPCLWSAQHFEKCRTLRKTAYAKMAKAIYKRTQVKFTIKRLKFEIGRLRYSYLRMIRKKQKNPHYNTLLWYASIFSFIENNDVINETVADDNKDVSSDDDYSFSESEELDQKRNQVLPRAHVLPIIELYKAATILWDTNHIHFAIRSEQKKAFDNILSTLSTKHNCHLTLDQLRYQIHYFRVYYFRARQRQIAAEDGNTRHFRKTLYFFDRLSFLEPFANKEKTAPKLQPNTETDPIEDFTYLTENRPLMMTFIELYKEQGCLWDQNHKDMDDPLAQSDAYDKIINMFSENGLDLTKEKVMSAIGYLESIVVSTMNVNKEPVWFYELLKFLGGDKRVVNKYCTHCSTQFRTLREYEKHKIEIAGDFPYKCALCAKGFLNRSTYSRHQNTHKEPHKCDLCDFTSFDKCYLKIHMRRHNQVRPHQCQNCDKAFVTTTELKRHIRVHTGERPYVCEICGKKMPANSEYNLHMRRHRNQRNHKCEVCGSAFFDPNGLRKHMTIHSDERKHVCDVCGAAFKTLHTLSQHKKLHDGKKRHVCKICGKGFVQQTGLYSHMKSQNHAVAQFSD